jgi:hypothetical protein
MPKYTFAVDGKKYTFTADNADDAQEALETHLESSAPHTPQPTAPDPSKDTLMMSMGRKLNDAVNTPALKPMWGSMRVLSQGVPYYGKNVPDDPDSIAYRQQHPMRALATEAIPSAVAGAATSAFLTPALAPMLGAAAKGAMTTAGALGAYKALGGTSAGLPSWLPLIGGSNAP